MSLLDRDTLPTTVMDGEFNVVAGLFLDGRKPIVAPPREWPRHPSYWDDEAEFKLKTCKTGCKCIPWEGIHPIDCPGTEVKLVVDRHTQFEVVWAGDMPDRHGGFSKGELLGTEGYDRKHSAFTQAGGSTTAVTGIYRNHYRVLPTHRSTVKV